MNIAADVDANMEIDDLSVVEIENDWEQPVESDDGGKEVEIKVVLDGEECEEENVKRTLSISHGALTSVPVCRLIFRIVHVMKCRNNYRCERKARDIEWRVRMTQWVGDSR